MKKYKNERVLCIGDTHIPYHHRDMLPFLKAVKETYQPDRIVHLGDEVDNHALNYHGSDPSLPGATEELFLARKFIRQLEALFPKMDLIESNHGSMYYRRAKTHGLPQQALLPYNDLLSVGDGWKWHLDKTITLSDRSHVYFHHGKSSNVALLSRNMGMNCVQGHYHSSYKVEYWANPLNLCWGMQLGGFFDDESLAFAYNKTTLHRPIVGCGIILDGQPKLLPMIKNKSGRWNGKVL